MWTNYLLTAVRNFFRHKFYSFINLLGLTIALMACTAIFLYVSHEWSYDRFHANSDRIFRINTEFGGNGQIYPTDVTPTALAPTLVRNFPETELTCRVYTPGKFSPMVVKYADKVFEEKGFIYADSTFLPSFLPSAGGSTADALNRPEQVVLTQKAAKKYFGDENPVGKSLEVGKGRMFLITGIAKDPAHPSHLEFDFVASFSSLSASKTEEWSPANYLTYARLAVGASPDQISAKINQLSDDLLKQVGQGGMGYIHFYFQPIEKIHLYQLSEGGQLADGDVRYVYIFTGIALMILLLACINYVNLATARSVYRAREVGMRKTLGATRLQLFAQYTSESLLVTFLALPLAIGLLSACLPFFNQLTGKEFETWDLFAPQFLVGLIGTTFAIGLLAGGYPALVLTRLEPVSVMKGSFKTSRAGVWLRQSLVILQFAISVLLMAGALIIYEQLSFMRDKKLGYDRSLVVALPMDGEIRKNAEAIQSNFLNLSQIEAVTAASENPTEIRGGYTVSLQGQEQDQKLITGLAISKGFLQTMKMDLIAGSDLSDADFEAATNPEDEARRYQFLLNEVAVSQLGFSVEEAVGKAIQLNGRMGEIKGVVRDFHFASLHEPIGSLVMFPEPEQANKILVRLQPGPIESHLAALQLAWRAVVTHRPFEAQFLDQHYEALYRSEAKLGQVFLLFSGMAVFIGCLGLLGLAAFTIVQRNKEIAIRKIMGASTLSLVGLLSTDFAKLVSIASMVGLGLAAWIFGQWLENFAYRISIGVSLVWPAAVAAVIIALATVSYQAVKAALSNPIHSLRND